MSKKGTFTNRLHLHSRDPKNHLRTKNLRASFLCHSKKAGTRNPVRDFLCETCLDSDQETIGLLVSLELKMRKIRPLGTTVQHLAWRLQGRQANSPGELHGRKDGTFFPGSERCQTVSQQDCLLDQGSLLLVMCSFSASVLGITWRCLLHIIFPTAFSCLGTFIKAGENCSVRYR